MNERRTAIVLQVTPQPHTPFAPHTPHRVHRIVPCALIPVCRFCFVRRRLICWILTAPASSISTKSWPGTPPPAPIPPLHDRTSPPPAPSPSPSPLSLWRQVRPVAPPGRQGRPQDHARGGPRVHVQLGRRVQRGRRAGTTAVRALLGGSVLAGAAAAQMTPRLTFCDIGTQITLEEFVDHFKVRPSPSSTQLRKMRPHPLPLTPVWITTGHFGVD